MKLIIVESPTKVKSFKKIFSDDKNIEVFATKGHIRDLPKYALGIKIDENFKPEYKPIKEKKDVIEKLKELAKNANEIILATDPDREGESISYHTAYYLGLIKENWPEFEITDPKRLKRIIFYEITPQELKKAIQNPSSLRKNLIKAQATRRILDRLVGYKISPLLWRKIGKRWLSAGRVQTVALRLIVEREKEREAFKTEEYYTVSANFKSGKTEFLALLKKLQDKPIEEKITLQLFAGDYTYKKTIIIEENKEEIEKRLSREEFSVTKIEKKTIFRQPPPPLTTSLLQQEANRNYGYSTKFTMKLAQDLYERGLITYHRTDSFNLSNQFIKAAQSFVAKTYGPEYVEESGRKYKTKSKLAQEAHEAIRPTNLNTTPDKLENLSARHKRIYQLIYTRAIATQMKPAAIEILNISIESKSKDLFQTRQEKTKFLGFLKAFGYTQTKTDFLKLKEGDKVKLKELLFEKKTTQPPPRYTEASLIKTLEEKGIGRPSTYAPIISLIQDKRYVEKEDKYFKPSILGATITDYLVKSFPDLFTLDFTANMEDQLDKIANNEEDLIKILKDFYKPLEKSLEKAHAEEGHINVQKEIDKKCPKCGKPLLIRFSKYGKFIGCSGYPECKYIENFKSIIEDVKCPKCGGKILKKRTKKGKQFYGCENYPKCDFASWKLPKNNNEN